MKKLLTSILCFSTVLASPIASASVVLHGTRVIYPSDARDVTIAMENEGSQPVLVQSWLDKGDPHSTPDNVDVPMILTPPLFRLDSHRTQTLRLIYTQADLPRDRESLFWLNVLEIPPKEATQTAEPTNKLQLILRTRVKVFFRPKELKDNARAAPAAIQWSIIRGADGGAVLRATNPTAYHANFNSIAPKVGERSYSVEGGGMVEPLTSKDFALTGLGSTSAALENVEYKFIDDFGAIIPGRFEAQRGG